MGDASYGLPGPANAVAVALGWRRPGCPFSQSVRPSSGAPGVQGRRGGVRPLPLGGDDDEDAVGGGDEALGAEELDGGE